MNRREFLLVAGSAVAVVPLAAALSGCGGGGGAAAPAAAGDFTITSTPDNTGHQHTITVKAADLAAGATVTYTTSLDFAHTHTVTITAAQFNDVNEGRTDNIGTNPDNTGHTHDFPVKKP